MTDWHILGAGAIGGLWACYLHKAGHRVELLLRDDARLEQYRRRGTFTLTGQESTETLALPAATSGRPGKEVDYLLVATKAHQTRSALAACAPRLSRECSLLLLQNGMGVTTQIEADFPGLPLFIGVTTDGAYCPEPFSVVHAGSGCTEIGTIGNRHDPQVIINRLPIGFLDIQATADIESRQWGKLAVNCAINALTVINQCRNGELLTRPGAMEQMARLSDEIQQVGTASGHGDQVTGLYQKILAVIETTAANFSSMYQDIENRRLTEIDYLNGYLIRQAEKHGIDCPENKKIYHKIKGLEKSRGCR